MFMSWSNVHAREQCLHMSNRSKYRTECVSHCSRVPFGHVLVKCKCHWGCSSFCITTSKIHDLLFSCVPFWHILVKCTLQQHNDTTTQQHNDTTTQWLIIIVGLIVIVRCLKKQNSKREQPIKNTSHDGTLCDPFQFQFSMYWLVLVCLKKNLPQSRTPPTMEHHIRFVLFPG